MGRASPTQASFNAGEISPLMMGRVDQSVYSIAGETMAGFVPLIQGPMAKCPGIRHVALAKGPCRLIEFEFNTTQSYMIEASNLAFRFYTNNVRIESGGSPYEVAHPYSFAHLGDLDYVASADVLYLVHGSHQQATLSRTGGSTFAYAALDLTGGPFDDGNTDETITVSATASTGDVDLFSNADIFLPGHAGGLFRMEARDYAEVPSWEPDATVNSGDLRTWEGKVYQVVGGTGRTGTVPPIHAEGVEWDGAGFGTDIAGKPRGGVQWAYLHDRFGILRITGYVSARQVHATVLRRLPFTAAAANSYATGVQYTPPYTGPSYTEGGQTFYKRFDIELIGGDPVYEPTEGDYQPPVPSGGSVATYVGPGTWRWAFGAFSAARGWPEHVFIWNERLVFTKGAAGYASVVGAYKDFRERNDAGEITADMAFRFTLNSPNAIRWVAGDEQLLIGTAKNEHVGSAMGGTGVPGPGNFKAPAQTDFGSAKVKPVSVGGRVLFVDKAGRRLYELDFAFQRDRFDADDLTVMAEHVTKSGVAWLARQAAPHSLVWAGMADGSLASLSYSPRQQVRSWARRPLAPGSFVRSGACIPDPAGARDQLWLAVERNGQWLIGFLADFRDAKDPIEDGFFVDHGLSYSGNPVTRITAGLEHLAGETVAWLGDGVKWGTAVVDNAGGFDMDGGAYSKVHAGLPYAAAFKSLRIEAGADDGSAQGKIKRISRLVIRLLDTPYLLARVQGGEWETLDPLAFGDVVEGAPKPVTGDWPLDCIGDYDRDGQIEFLSDAPLPACILSITPTLKTGTA